MESQVQGYPTDNYHKKSSIYFELGALPFWSAVYPYYYLTSVSVINDLFSELTI